MRCVLEHDSNNHAGPFSPDGRWLIVVRSFSNTRDELWLVDITGVDPPRLLSTPNEEAVYERPEWSPDGRSIYALSDLGRDLAAPACLDVASGQLTFVVDPELDVDETALDPTGQRLAYVLNRDGEAEIVVRELESGAECTIGGLPPGALYSYWQNGLAWDRAGAQLAISWTASRASPNRSISLPSDSNAHQATKAGGLHVNPSTLPGPEHVRYPTFDGREIPALYYASGSSSGKTG